MSTWSKKLQLTEEWEKEKHEKNDAVVRALFVNKYKEISYSLPSQNENDVDRMYFIWEDDIVWCWGRDGGWTIFGQYKDPVVEEEKTTPFLAVTCICDRIQADGIRILQPEIGTSDWEVNNPDVNNL